MMLGSVAYLVRGRGDGRRSSSSSSSSSSMQHSRLGQVQLMAAQCDPWQRAGLQCSSRDVPVACRPGSAAAMVLLSARGLHYVYTGLLRPAVYSLL
jgi:hypothetical protein